ncbi:nudC domain-containing protein 1-like [Babylonia areolata]|uniref:nudC domain-containing protein 1-like n=1 Tax=Babylonia areolata TaxID=304850 RepID=UPI003FD470B0
MASRVDLKPRKELINPNFDGYKLSLEPLPTYQQELEKAVDVCTLTQDQLTSHHAKLFAAPNHLTADLWAENSVYVVDSSWTLRHIFLHESNKVDSGCRVFDIPQAAEFRQVAGRLNVSLRFAGPQVAVLADGAGRLFLLDTGDRSRKSGQWKVLVKEGEVLGEGVVFSVVDAACYTGEDKQDCVDCLLASVETGGQDSPQRPHPLTVLTWLTLTADSKGSWTVSRTRRLEGTRPFDYASLERAGGGAVTIASNRPYVLVSDSVKEVSSPLDGAASAGGGDWEMVGREPQHPLYTWSQTTEDVTVQLTLPADTAKPDVYVSLGSDCLDIGVKNSVTLLRGSLRDRIDVAASTWTVEGQKLELSLTKETEGMWDILVPGDTRGEMTLDEATIAAIHDRLKHLTSDKWNPDPDGDNKPYNTQQLEACDAVDDDECIYLMRIDGETHSISHQATISYTLLFTVGLEADKPPALCLRHDVDGLVWQPDRLSNLQGPGSAAGGTAGVSGSNPWRHAGTLDAFGYVQASKTQRRFSACAPDFSLAAIADCKRHVYLYRQRAPVATPLRNRKTSRDVSSVAKQHVVVIDPPEGVVGLYVSNDHVFVATPLRVYAVAVSQDA